ncbi:MAG: GNAT family N-acetyltransferase [Planctomycetota bacterium]
MTLHIRSARPDDAETIHAFICGLAEYEREPDAVEVTPTELADQLAQSQPPFECLLAERDGEPVGFALFFMNYSTWRGRPGLYLEDLFVPPELRGDGIGGALLQRLAELTVDRGGARLEWSVLDWNEPAIRFYESLGATALDEWTTWRLTGAALRSLGAPSSGRTPPPAR